jgi:hypothetical protein
MTARLVIADPLGRVNIAQPDRQYLLHEEDDGTLVLEPAVVISELEHRFLANAALQVKIAHAGDHPEGRVERQPRSERST